MNLSWLLENSIMNIQSVLPDNSTHENYRANDQSCFDLGTKKFLIPHSVEQLQIQNHINPPVWRKSIHFLNYWWKFHGFEKCRFNLIRISSLWFSQFSKHLFWIISNRESQNLMTHHIDFRSELGASKRAGVSRIRNSPWEKNQQKKLWTLRKSKKSKKWKIAR